MTLLPILTKLQNELTNAPYHQARTDAGRQHTWVPFTGTMPQFVGPIMETTENAPVKDALATWKETFQGAPLERMPTNDLFILHHEPEPMDPILQEQLWVDEFLRYWI